MPCESNNYGYNVYGSKDDIYSNFIINFKFYILFFLVATTSSNILLDYWFYTSQKERSKLLFQLQIKNLSKIHTKDCTNDNINEY
jgi:hypothetical protein